MNHENPQEGLQAQGATASENTETAATPADELEALRGENEQLKASIVHIKEEDLRNRAELENQRKRLARDVDMARKFANERLLGDLLPVFDSLHAGLAQCGNEESPLKSGLELTLKQLLKVATDNGLVEVNPHGQAFNPDQHQAVSQAPAGDIPSGHVAQVFQRGYLLNERLLRPALVVVAE
jgi:molecular chaperone GrpE